LNQPKKSSAWWKYLLIILSVIAILFLIYLILAYVANKIDSKYVTNTNMPSATTKTSDSKIDSALVGTWDTGCLVPDPGSPWAEEHKFVIGSDGKAVHTRSSGESCAALRSDGDQNYTITIPASGQINLASSAGSIYDMYQVSGNTLKFGHGFCNCTKLCSVSGGATEGDRITCLNEFLVYKK
jgi:hypothetical protein